MPRLRQSSHRDIGDIISIDERLAHIRNRQHQLTSQNAVQQEGLAEILEEPAGTDDRVADTGLLQRFLRRQGLVLAAPGKQDQMPHTLFERQPRQGSDRLDSARHSQIRLIADIGGIDTVKRCSPARRIGPVERGNRGS